MKKILLALAVLTINVLPSFATVWTVTNSGFTFSPDPLTITQGDSVRFVLTSPHNAEEVSQATWNANSNNPLTGFATPPTGGLVTGLTAGTHYYVCDPHASLGMKGRIVVQAATTVVVPNVWINELHYDNNGTDVNEGYEIAGPAGTDLACYRVHLYSGATGTVYHADTLSGVIPNQSCGYGTIWFPRAGIQNGSPDGIALEYAPQALNCANNVDTVLQFLSYEGVFTATAGRANGLTSTDIGVIESATSPVGNSLQLLGFGTSYSQFAWAGSATNTYNQVNSNQFFCSGTQASYSFNPVIATVSEAAGTLVIGYVKVANLAVQTQTVDVVIKSGTGNAADINNYTTQTLSFTPGLDSLALTLTITDDALVEGTESIVFALRNPSLNGTIDADSLFTLNITDNDANTNPSIEFVLPSSSNSEGVDSFQLALTITNPNANPTSVDINVLSGGTATFGSDFTYAPITVTFPGGSSFAQFVTVHITDDILVEGNETFTFQLAGQTNNATLGANAQHVVTIVDNDTLHLSFGGTGQTVNENVGTVTIPVSLSNTSPNATNVTVHLETIGTTATQGADFYFNDTTLIWSAGSYGPILVPVTIFDDNIVEPNETIKFRLTNATNGASFASDTYQLTIINNDTVDRNCTDLFFSEYIEGTSNNKAIEIFNPTSAAVNLADYKIFKSTNGGSSTSVFGLNGTLAPGDVYVGAHLSAAIPVASQADTLSGFFSYTGNDALALVHLTDTIDVIGRIGDDPGTGWVVDTGSTDNHTLIRSYYIYHGDSSWAAAATTWNAYPVDMFDSLGAHHMAACGTVPPASISFTVVNETANEDAGTVTVLVRVDNPGATLVDFFVARNDPASTALPGVDFNFGNQHVTTSVGGTTYDTVHIAILEDALLEPTETSVLHFVGVSANTNVLADSVYTLYIRDNDTLTVSFTGAGFGYIEQDTTVAIKVKISTFTTDTTKVNVTLAPGNATSGLDFIFHDTTLVFLPNSTDTQSAWITILDDNLVEANEQINFDLWDATNGAHLGIAAFTLTIIDNDSTVGILPIESDDKIALFPNPVINTLTLLTDKEYGLAELTDLLGNVMMRQEELYAGKNIMDVSSLPPGMYFLNILDESQRRFTRHFIKQNN